MKAEIISVGTELLMGSILNTNAQYIAQKLCDMGIDSYYQTTVGDNHDRLSAAVQEAVSRSDIVILTGGLGPTGDDLTKKTVADAFGLKMVMNDAEVKHLYEHFNHMNFEMSPNNLKQAEFPEGCIIMPNPNGTAPGCIVEDNGHAAILMPGPPREMVPMFEACVLPYLEKRSGYILHSHELRIFGKGESAAEYALRDLIEAQTNPTIAPYALNGELKLRVTAKCHDREEGERLSAPVIERICEILGDVVYSVNGEELHEVCARLLAENRLTLSVAESCTGGMIAAKLVSVPGISSYFIEGAIAYSNQAKMARLGVKAETLARFGAVSRETAVEMAEGMLRSSGTDLALAVTGIAGPDGGTVEKPVGLVYVALASNRGETIVRELNLRGNRERIRNSAALNALDLLRRYF